MPDFESGYDALKAEMSKIDISAPKAWNKARVAVQGWPYWTPVVILAAIAGHCV